MKIIFHLGTHKTGTTYIQETLDENSTLLKTHNIRYFTLHKELSFLHKAFYPEAYGAYYSDELVDEAIDKIFSIITSTNFDKYIISGEDMSGYIWDWTKRLNILEKITARFPNYEIEVLVYFRNQVSACISIYQELVKGNKFTYDFDSFIVDNEFSIFTGGLDWNKRVNQIIEIVKPDKLTVRCFETAVDNNLLNDFAFNTGIPTEINLKQSNIKNSSVNISQLEKMLECNLELNGDKLIKKKDEILQSNIHGPSLSNLLSINEKRSLLDFYYDSNSKLFKNHINESLNQAWYNDKRKE